MQEVEGAALEALVLQLLVLLQIQYVLPLEQVVLV